MNQWEGGSVRGRAAICTPCSPWPYGPPLQYLASIELKEVVLASWVLPDSSPSSGGQEFVAMYSTVLPSLQCGAASNQQSLEVWLSSELAREWTAGQRQMASWRSPENCVLGRVEPSSLLNSTSSLRRNSMETSQVKSAGVSTSLGGLISHRGEWDSILIC